MGCYSNNYKQMCSKIVIGVSCLMGLMALLSIIFGVIQLGKIPMTRDQKQVFQIQGLEGGGKGIGQGNIGLGVVGLLIACLGCLTGARKNPCFAIPYGLLTFAVTIIFLVVAIIAGGISSSTGQKIIFDTACGLTTTIPKSGGKTFNSNIDLNAEYTRPTCILSF